MRPFGVVVVDPPVELGLGGLERGERPAVQELLTQALVESFDLARRGGRTHGGVTMRDAVLPADSVEQHLYGLRPEPAGEYLAVVGQDLVGDPVASECR